MSLTTAQEYATIYKRAIDCGNDKIAKWSLRVLWEEYPRELYRAVGRREAVAINLLGEVFRQVSTEFDLSENCVRNGVMNGLEMDSGAHFVNVFFCYKNKEGYSATSSLIQEAPTTNLFPDVYYHEPGGTPDAHGYGGAQDFDTDFSNHIELFRHLLNVVIAGRHYGPKDHPGESYR